MSSRVGGYSFPVVLAAFMLTSCTASRRSLQMDEIAGSKADEILIFTTDRRVISAHPDSCLMADADSQQVLCVSGREFPEFPARKVSVPFRGNLARAEVDSIEGRYRPEADLAAPALAVPLVGLMLVLVLISFHVLDPWRQ